MGLAASQARFLGITARKNACELRTMEIAQERLSVSNQLSQASQAYMNSLNATRLVWNPEYTDDFIYNLDYESMSRPSSFNDYSLQMLSNIKGQAVLNSSFYNALKNVVNVNGETLFTADTEHYPSLTTAVSFDDFAHGGIDMNVGNFKLFIEALAQQGIITEAQKAQMNAALDYQTDGTHASLFPAYNNNIHPEITDTRYRDSNYNGTAYSYLNGFGRDMASTTDIYSTDLMGLCSYIDNITNINGDSFIQELYETYGSNPLAPTPYDNAANVQRFLNFDYFKNIVSGISHISVVANAEVPQGIPPETGSTNTTPYNAADVIASYIDNAHVDQWPNPGEIDWQNNWFDSFNFADVMGTNDLALVGYGSTAYGGIMGMAGDDSPNSSYVETIDAFVQTLVNLAKDFFEYAGDNSDDETALNNTIRIIEALYKDSDGNLVTTNAGYIHSGNVYTGGIPDYLNYCTPVMQESEHTPGRYAVALSLSNFAQAFFTEYENQRSKGTSGYQIATSTGFLGDCNLISMNENYIYDYVDAGTTPPSGEVAQILNYYGQMFNQICAKGFVYNSAVDNPDNLQNMIKNGYLAINTLGDDNYFYQYDYMAFTKGHGYFKEVADEDEITKAEAEYKVRQAQLNAKEEELSVDMQSVEAELAALSTEYDTVKNLISKSVQKDFTACAGGG